MIGYYCPICGSEFEVNRVLDTLIESKCIPCKTIGISTLLRILKTKRNISKIYHSFEISVVYIERVDNE